MTVDAGFDYTEVFPSADAEQASSIIAYLERSGQPLQAVVWSHRHGDWVYAPGPAARILYDDQQFDLTKDIDRQTAERVARESLGTELPDEVTLFQLCEEGARSGLTYGPPVS